MTAGGEAAHFQFALQLLAKDYSGRIILAFDLSSFSAAIAILTLIIVFFYSVKFPCWTMFCFLVLADHFVLTASSSVAMVDLLNSKRGVSPLVI